MNREECTIKQPRRKDANLNRFHGVIAAYGNRLEWFRISRSFYVVFLRTFRGRGYGYWHISPRGEIKVVHRDILCAFCHLIVAV